MTRKMEAYVLSSMPAPWGDYGRILVHGMTSHLARCDGLLQLERVEQTIQLIRSLNSRFCIVSRDDASLVVRVDSARIDGREVACVIEFQVPSRSCASEWDAAEEQWRSRPDFATPIEGQINEAFIKPVGDGYALSFAELCEPLVRWGLSADAALVRPAA